MPVERIGDSFYPTPWSPIMALDKDLQSIQEVRDLCKKAKDAQLQFKSFSQEQVDRIVKAMAEAGYRQSERLAKMACEETGFGKWQDKKLKNEFGSRMIYESIKDLKTVGVIARHPEKKIVEIAEPMGVVAALIPSTNPTSTSFFKTLISVKTRNAIVASPHPRAVRCTVEAMRLMAETAEREGAPRGLITCLTTVTLEGTNELMRHKDVAVILATGSTSMVRAAYSSGKPAYGVGPGNVPAFIERTANIKKAVADVISGKLFDYGVLCSTESAMIVDKPIREQVIQECKKLGAYFGNAEEKAKLEKVVVLPQSQINPEIVGKPATFIAHAAGIEVPPETTVLIAELTGVGPDHPLSMEKLSPVLSFYSEDGWLDACHRCVELLEFGGIGHTLVIHSHDEDVIMRFALEKPALRILVNTQAALGAIGYTTGLDPSLTLGPGTLGGSIISENVTARHLMNIKRLAYETHPINPAKGGQQDSGIRMPEVSGKQTWIEEIEERIRLKAGNPPVVSEKQKPELRSQKPEVPQSPAKRNRVPSSGQDGMAPKAFIGYQKTEGEKSDAKEPAIYGTGISESEIERIMSEFSKR
jgi:acetaldehyde dehydrogenase (acetylating)